MKDTVEASTSDDLDQKKDENQAVVNDSNNMRKGRRITKGSLGDPAKISALGFHKVTFPKNFIDDKYDSEPSKCSCVIL